MHACMQKQEVEGEREFCFPGRVAERGSLFCEKRDFVVKVFFFSLSLSRIGGHISNSRKGVGGGGD